MIPNFFFVSDGVRLRDEHRRRDQRSYSSRRSSTDSSEEGLNLNIRDLKVWIFFPLVFREITNVIETFVK